MNQEFKQCLESRKIIPFARGKKLAEKELSIAQSDLSDAKAGFENQRYKWSTIQAYYAMFHAARALISDINSELIDFYKAIRSGPQAVW